jgi:predicted nucleotidyltransferase
MFDRKIKENYDLGLPYALARQKTFDELAPALAPILKSPNNLLAIEYIRAAEGELEPFTVPRRGAPHDGVQGEDLSASAIREELRAGGKVPYSMPEFARTIYLDEQKAGRAPVFLENAERAVLSHLRRMTADDFREIPDTGEGLSERIVAAISESAALSEIADRAKTKRYAHSRIRRILTRAFFGLTADLPVTPPYLRVLAFNERGREFLRAAKKDGPELLTRPSDVKRMSREAQKLGELEARIADLYGLFMPSPALCGDEWRRTPVYVV